MEFIKKDVLEKYIENKSVIEAKDLARFIEKQCDITVTLKSNNNLRLNEISEEKKQKITDEIFSNEEILEQLRRSAQESDEDLIFSKDEFMEIIREVQK